MKNKRGRPFKAQAERVIITSICFTPETYEMLEKVSHQQSTSKSKVIQVALQRLFSENINAE